MRQRLTFFGGGNMASAILNGLAGLEGDWPVTVVDPVETVRQRHGDAGRATYGSIADTRDVAVGVLAFKPQHFVGAVEALKESLAPNALVVSIMVGVGSDTISSALPGRRIVRVMPNTPMAVGQGMSGVAAGAGATPADLDLVSEVFGASGGVLRVAENKIDDVAAISGSGPAYFFRFCEVLVKAAEHECGFTQAEAVELVSHTARGAIAYLDAQEGYPAGRLRQEVTSPGGTTQAALGVFELEDFEGMVARVLQAAKARAKELNDSVNE